MIFGCFKRILSKTGKTAWESCRKMADMMCAITVLSLIAAAWPQQASPAPSRPVSVSKVTDVSGKVGSIPSKKAKATVLLFVGTDCPIANRLAPEMSRIVHDYKSKGIDCWLVYPNRELKAAEVVKHMKSFALNCRATIDRKHALVKAAGATVTPQAVILDPKGVIRYLGRINDLYEEHGKTNPEPKVHDLRISLDAILGGKPVPNPVTEAIGCYIED